MYAVIATGGKQARVEVGATLDVELLGADVGADVAFPVVLLVDGDDVRAGASVAGTMAHGRVVGESTGPKIVGYTYKPKTRGRRCWGHRQHYARVEITAISPAS